MGDALPVIEREAAIRSVEAELEREYQETLEFGADPIRVAVIHVEEHELVWIVSCQSEEYLRTRDPGHMLVGHGPYLVDRIDGGLHQIGPVSSATRAWETDYRVRIRGLVVRTPVDALHEEIRDTAAAHGRLVAMRELRSRLPTLHLGQVNEYVTALQVGDAPPHLVAVASEALLEPVHPVHSVRTIHTADSRSAH